MAFTQRCSLSGAIAAPSARAVVFRSSFHGANFGRSTSQPSRRWKSGNYLIPLLACMVAGAAKISHSVDVTLRSLDRSLDVCVELLIVTLLQSSSCRERQSPELEQMS